MRKIYLVPNFVTTANMFCGFYSIVAATQGKFVVAAWAIIAAGVFDMLDGRIARLAKATSQFGVEYDSLSDLISFGAAPAILLYQWVLSPYERLGWLAAFLFLTCGALRLARFNVNSASLPKNYFQGLPIPIAAGMVATFVIFYHATSLAEGTPDSSLESFEGISVLLAQFSQIKEPFVLALTFGLSTLMVSNVRFPSFKELNWRSRATFGYLMVGVLSMILIAARPEIMLFVLLSSYVGLSLIWNGVRLLKKSPQSSSAGASPSSGRGNFSL